MMKNRLLGTVAAVALSLISVIALNVCSVYAAVEKSEVFYAEKSLNAEKTVFYGSGVKTGTNNKYGSFEGQVGANAYKTTIRTSDIEPDKSETIGFVIETGYKGDFYIVARSNGSDNRTLILSDDDPLTEDISKDTTATKNDNVALVEFKGLSSGTYTLNASGKYQYSLLVLDLSKTEITSDEYVWELNTEGLDSDIADNLTFGAAEPASDTARTLTYSGSKYTTTEDFPITVNVDVNGSNDSYINVSSEFIGETQYKKYTITVTPDMSWFEEKASYTVSGNVYDSSTGNAVSGLTISTENNGTGSAATGTGFEVTGIVGAAKITFSAKGYMSKTIEVTEANDSIVVDLVPTVINDGTNKLSVNNIFAREGYEPTGADNVDSFAITVNGFVLSNTKLQITDNDNKSVAKDGYIGRINLGSDSSQITYTAPSNGKIVVHAVTGSNSDLTRAVVVTQGSTEVANIVTDKASTIIKGTFGVEKGKAYVFKRKGGVNIYAIEFVASDGIDATITKVKDSATDLYAVDGVNNVTYIIHKVTPDEMKEDRLNETKTGFSTNVVYNEVVFSDSTSLKATDVNAEALYAFMVTDAGTAPTSIFTWTASADE